MLVPSQIRYRAHSFGGAIESLRGVLTVERCFFQGNRARLAVGGLVEGNGGAIFAHGGPSSKAFAFS